MPADLEELLVGLSLFASEMVEDSPDALKIKGFVSVEIPDRHGDVALAEGFLINRYLTAPAILVNHELWYGDGNGRPVGRADNLHVVRIEEHPEDDNLVLIRDINSNIIISDYDRKKLPEVPLGTKGLFVFATVTNPEVIQMVKNGELSAFSWMGRAKRSYRINEASRLVENVIEMADILEISLVVAPVNFAASMTVGKSIYSLKFDKQIFTTRGEVARFLVDHCFSDSNNNRLDIKEDAKSFYAQLLPDTAKKALGNFETVSCGAGLSAVAGDLEHSDVLMKAFGLQTDRSENMADEKKTEKQEETKGDAFDPVVFKSELIDSIKSMVAELVTPQSDIIKKLSEGFADLSQRVDELAAKSEETEEPKTEETEEVKTEEAAEEKADDEKKEETHEAADDTKTEESATVQDVVEAVAKSFRQELDDLKELFSKAVPSSGERDEKLVRKSEKKDDPNSVFDTIPFFAGLKKAR